MKTTTAKLESIIGKEFNKNILYLGLLCNKSCKVKSPRKYTFLYDNNLMLIPEKKLINILKKYD